MTELEQKELERRAYRAKERAFIDALDKAIPIPPIVVDPPKRGWQKQVSCRRCGSVVSEAHWSYCPHCGQAFLNASYAGPRGWNSEEAETAYRKIMEAGT